MPIYADIFIDMATADADGTALTQTIMNNGTRVTANYSSWGADPNPPGTFPPAGMTIESPTGLKRYDQVCIPGYALSPNSTTRAIKYLHTSANLTAVEIFLNGLTTPRATCFGLIKLGPSNAGVSSGLYDLVHFVTAFSGNFAVMQLNNGSGVSPGDYIMAIETNPGGTTTHSQSIRVTPGGIYWFNLWADFNWKPGRTAGTTASTGGLAKLAIFHPYTGQLLGQAFGPTRQVVAPIDADDVIGSIQIGNGEAGTDAGTFTYFKHVGIDFTNARFPILPRPIRQMPFALAAAAGLTAAQEVPAFTMFVNEQTRGEQWI